MGGFWGLGWGTGNRNILPLWLQLAVIQSFSMLYVVYSSELLLMRKLNKEIIAAKTHNTNNYVNYLNLTHSVQKLKSHTAFTGRTGALSLWGKEQVWFQKCVCVCVVGLGGVNGYCFS